MGIAELDRDLEEVVTLYKGGTHSTDIAARYEVTYDSVLKRLRAQGVTIRPRGGGRKCPRRLTPEQEQKVIARYRAGEDLESIAKDFNVERKTAWRTLARYDVPRRPPGGIPNPLPERDRPPTTCPQVTGYGYLKVWLPRDHPYAKMCGSRGWLPEHRLVMAEHLGRPLTAIETVHHRNGKRDDNRIENLDLRQGKHGRGQSWQCADCGSRNLVAT